MLPTLLPTRVGSILGVLSWVFSSFPMLPTLSREGSRVEGGLNTFLPFLVSTTDCGRGDVMSPEQTD